MNYQIQNDLGLKNCTFVKTILMILVILGHACDFWVGDWFTCNPLIKSQTISVFATWLNSFHIFAFTLVSGYIFASKVTGGVSKLCVISQK